MFNSNEILMIGMAIESHIGHLQNLKGSTNDPEFTEEISADIADYSALHMKLQEKTLVDSQGSYNEIYLLKTRDFGEDASQGRLIAVYSDEEVIKEEVEKCNILYKDELQCHFWYEPYTMNN